MSEDHIKLTYEILFEILRREKERGELQKLDNTFFKDFSEYLLEKSEILQTADKQSLFDEQEKLKTLNEITNIKKIIKELYEKRERKIIELVINKSRTNSSLITGQNLLPEEISLHDLLLKMLNENRKNVLHSTLDIEKIKINRAKKETVQNMKLIKFKKEVDKFVGKELEIYGPFKIEDVANIPVEIADILIQKEKAEAVKVE